MGIKEMPRLARFIPKIMLAITVTACDEVYRKIACWLNDMGETQASSFTHCYTDMQSILYPEIFTDVSCELQLVISFDGTSRFSTENYRLQSAYEKNLIIKMVLVSDFS